MQQKSSFPTIFELASEHLRLMKNSLHVFSSRQDEEMVKALEGFLEAKPTPEAILNQFKSILNRFSADKLNQLTGEFISRATASFVPRLHNNQQVALALPSDVLNNSLLPKIWQPFWLKNFVLVCRDFHLWFQEHKVFLRKQLEKSSSSPSEASSSAEKVTQPNEPVAKEVVIKKIEFGAIKETDKEKGKKAYSKLFVPSFTHFFGRVVFLDDMDPKILRIFDCNTQKEVAVLNHDAVVMEVTQSATGDKLIVLGEKQGCDVYLMPSFPDEDSLGPYKASCILVGKNLKYVTLMSQYEHVNINDTNKLLDITINYMKEKLKSADLRTFVHKLYLSAEQVRDLITSNGGHIPSQLSVYIWDMLVGTLIEKYDCPKDSKPKEIIEKFVHQYSIGASQVVFTEIDDKNPQLTKVSFTVKTYGQTPALSSTSDPVLTYTRDNISAPPLFLTSDGSRVFALYVVSDSEPQGFFGDPAKAFYYLQEWNVQSDKPQESANILKLTLNRNNVLPIFFKSDIFLIANFLVTSDKRYLIFSGKCFKPSNRNEIVLYDLEKNKILSVTPTLRDQDYYRYSRLFFLPEGRIAHVTSKNSFVRNAFLEGTEIEVVEFPQLLEEYKKEKTSFVSWEKENELMQANGNSSSVASGAEPTTTTATTTTTTATTMTTTIAPTISVVTAPPTDIPVMINQFISSLRDSILGLGGSSVQPTTTTTTTTTTTATTATTTTTTIAPTITTAAIPVVFNQLPTGQIPQQTNRSAANLTTPQNISRPG